MLLMPILGRAQATLTLTTPVVTGIPATTVQFSGTLTNTSSSTIYLNDLTFSFTGAGLAADNTRFFDLVAASLDPGESYTGVLFEVGIDGTTANGSYTGTVTVSGGAAAMATNVLTLATFRVSVVARFMSGTVALLGISNSVVPITFEFRPVDGSAIFTRSMQLSTTGAYAITGLPAKKYVVHAKGDRWLAMNAGADGTNGNMTGVNFLLLPGDANNDNVVDIVDFGTLVNAYGGDSGVAGSTYDVHADFNNDGVVDIDDFGQLVNQYGNNGAP